MVGYIECAIRDHDFKEIIDHPHTHGLWSDAAVVEAWIDGRRRGLCRGQFYQAPCGDCRQVRSNLYIPGSKR
ncbi:MAG: hypothetical protein ABSC19_13870 [Syntrophorhabdales bacterium]